MSDPAETLDLRRKRLRYRSWHRGCKETDVILGNYADQHLHRLDSAGLDRYEALLEEEDADIWAWLTGQNGPAPEMYRSLIAELLEYKP